VGLVIGHVAPEALLGGPLALVEDGDTITVDINEDRLDCLEFDQPDTLARRRAAWEAAVEANGGLHPDATAVTHRVLRRMRVTALPALQGAGMVDG
jgi:dihydroxy-acid dehydratase